MCGTELRREIWRTIPGIGRDTILTSRDANILLIEQKDRSPLQNGGSEDQIDSLESSLIGDITIGNATGSRIDNPKNFDTKPGLEWRPRREIVETDEEKRRRVKGKAHAIDDEGIPRRMVEGPSDGPLRIREREDGETARNQTDQLQISRINKDNNTDVIPQTEGALANRSNETPERRKYQEEDDVSMEDGEFNKMVDYYNELGMAEEMIDEDDMLDDIVVPETQMMAVESENEQIEAIAQLRQKVISKDHTSNTRQNKDPPDQKQIDASWLETTDGIGMGVCSV
ncbi:hypothetical protein HID58_065283 [Brassica napus]|uniref:Uncharacterized protein n=1 Tax=Brassica napus TaxID=3708 RepID=A0ABQ7ZCC8_BRANA|nr:hypothetical protein HID58_065283 [Brassica napus]